MNLIKDKIQQEALARWELAGRKGLLAMGTGTGKSRIALLRMEQLYEQHGSSTRILLAVPTETLRDENWPTEAKEWGLESIYGECVEGVCYASLAKKPSGHYHLVVLDEAHRLTPGNAKFLENITYDEILALTATEPKEKEKRQILDKIAPTVFTYTLDEGVEDGVAAEYIIYVIEIPPDDTNKVFKVKPKKGKSFMVTEKKQYEYKTASLMRMIMSKNIPKKDMIVKMMMIRRAQMIYNLRSKTEFAKIVFNKLVEDKRTVLFCGSIAQADELGGANVYHSKSDKEALNAFKAEDISYLAVVNALNEGHNIPNLDQVIIVQLNSNERDLIQRLGRAVRFRPGHVANIFLLVSQGTVDEDWVKKALASIDPQKIVYLSYKNFL